MTEKTSSPRRERFLDMLAAMGGGVIGSVLFLVGLVLLQAPENPRRATTTCFPASGCVTLRPPLTPEEAARLVQVPHAPSSPTVTLAPWPLDGSSHLILTPQ